MSTGWIRPVSGLVASQVVVHWVVFVSQCPLMASLGSRTGVLSGGSKTLGVVEGDALSDALYMSQAQYHSRCNSVSHVLQQLPTIASALSHYRERIPNNVSTCSNVDVCSRALWAVCLY